MERGRIKRIPVHWGVVVFDSQSGELLFFHFLSWFTTANAGLPSSAVYETFRSWCSGLYAISESRFDPQLHLNTQQREHGV